MAVNLSVSATVVDLRHDSPRPTDLFCVDTNVWYWVAYTRATLLPKHKQPRPYQATEYPLFIKNCLRGGAQLTTCPLAGGEIAHIIERTERDIFSLNAASTSEKEYRHNHPNERNRVTNEIDAAWKQVCSMSNILAGIVDDTTVAAAIHRLSGDKLDGYDALAVEHLLQSSVRNVITDDCDFTTVPGLTVFTANNTAISAAQAQGRLVVR